MKNVTISLDDDIWRQARVHAAEHGTSLSALVKHYLQTLTAKPIASEVREVGTGWVGFPSEGYATPEEARAADPTLPPGAYGRFADGAPFFTPGGRPRQPGAMRGMLEWTEEADSWPEGFLDAANFEDTPAARTWWMTTEQKAAYLAKSKSG